jgi:hypothetical protein
MGCAFPIIESSITITTLTKKLYCLSFIISIMLTRIYDYKEQRERASKALKLNDNDRIINPRLRLFAMSTTGTKPT